MSDSLPVRSMKMVSYFDFMVVVMLLQQNQSPLHTKLFTDHCRTNQQSVVKGSVSRMPRFARMLRFDHMHILEFCKFVCNSKSKVNFFCSVQK